MPANSHQSITQKIRRFYEHHSFPGYDAVDNADSLRQKAQNNLYISLLNHQLPQNQTILEIGCGTGQLANLLGLSNHSIVGVDLSLASLKLAQAFKKSQFINPTNFIQMDIFKPCFIPASFDITLSNGVLHHTPDPKTAFANMVNLTKPGGLVILGLYNPFGRAFTNIRRYLFRHLGRVDWLDYYLSQKNFPENKKQIWFKDQYQNPHESQHTVNEILGWFDHHRVNFLNAVPKITLFDHLTPKEHLFNPHRRGAKLEHLASQLLWTITQAREGGLFILIGRKAK